MAFSLAKDIKNKKKGFFKCINNKRNIRGIVGPLLNETVTLVTEVAEKTKMLNAFLASVFTTKAASGKPDPGDQKEGLKKGILPLD